MADSTSKLTILEKIAQGTAAMSASKAMLRVQYGPGAEFLYALLVSTIKNSMVIKELLDNANAPESVKLAAQMAIVEHSASVLTLFSQYARLDEKVCDAVRSAADRDLDILTAISNM